MRLAIACLLFLIALQSPSPSMIEGVVLDANDNRPVVGVQLTLPLPGRPSVTATTDSEGRFEFEEIQAGSYRLSTMKEGYAPAHADGRTTPGRAGIPVAVKSGESVRGMQIHLVKSAVITGRIFDTRGQAIVRAGVSLMRKVYDENGATTMTASNYAATDDRGEFRVFGIFPGSYYVFADSVSANGMATAPVYYPGTPDSVQATMVTLRSGDETRLGDMIVSMVKDVPVHLNIRNQTGQDPPLMVIEVRKDGITKINRGVPLPSDTYTLNSMTPGAYDIGVGLQGSDGFLFSHVEVQVDDSPVESTVTIRKGWRVTGKADLQNQGGDLRPAAGVRITLGLPGSADTRSATSNADGSFGVDGVTEGLRRVRVDELPVNSYVISVKDGDRDALTDGIRVNADSTLRVLIGESGGTIDGTVQNAENTKISDAIVVLIPDGSNQKKSYLYRTADSDQNGTFTIRGIAPGGYHLYAWRELEGAAYLNADFMKAYAGQGTAVTIETGGRLTVTLNL